MNPAISLVVRLATIDDLETIVGLTRRRRHVLAEWEDPYWRPRAGIDEQHPFFLQWCIEHNPRCIVFVAVENNIVVGCVFAVNQGQHTFLDDFCVDGERWSDVGNALLHEVATTETTTNRLLLCAPTKDAKEHEWLTASKAVHSSTFFAIPVGARHVAADNADTAADLALPSAIATPPQHVFGTFNEKTENGLNVSTVHGYAIGSPPVLPPPFDPGGPTTVVDRIIGTNRALVLEHILRAAAQRGDAQVIVIADNDDTELVGILRAKQAAKGAADPVNLWVRKIDRA
jgi:hypothetical protein